MISFYPGPSKVWDRLPVYMQDAWQSGMLSVNHRSPQFARLWQDLVLELHLKLHIPPDYQILPFSSATECWEVIAQSLLGPAGQSLHLYNGAFGEKWQEYTLRLTGAAQGYPFGLDQLPHPQQLPLQDSPLLALTHNETSNGTALPDAYMEQLRQAWPEVLIAADATSSMAALALPWHAADLWFASVQKGFGLPAGLALLICSPRAVAAAEKRGENSHYNSLLFSLENARKQQTTHTPNVLGLYLLWRSLKDRPPMAETDRLIRHRHRQWLQFWQEVGVFTPLCPAPVLQSPSVLALQGGKEAISSLKQAALERGFYLGNGYGRWKESSFRIANFPALTDSDIDQLQAFLREWCAARG
ncbi:aminotransferase class V-fold PLP-dependent enzyme [Cesiribacter andamanensis]|uniref:Putative phosphoserine aminotransferase n=1 Tax=Cesiribacter andamanensis AMV16 TaxID=1279009 RepID=M7NSQ5_9BACT|nr:aminotransferase class V-fold PLP-dependent enzyme [Cesiribacter andamanensis]EMR01529.1 Putative phosphoserine aminotransferase [Cesiribacter andamanensis AMV16]